MQIVKQYSLINEYLENQPPILVRDGKALDIKTEGSVLEAQLELEDGSVLIWLTEDSPYDEGLHVYLLDKHDTLLDTLEASADFTPGILKITKTEENWVEFKFFSSDCIYQLEVTKEASLRVLLPMGWKYKKLLNLHKLIVHEIREGKV